MDENKASARYILLQISWEPNSGIHFKYHELYLQIEWKPCDYAAEDQSKSRNLECQESTIFSLWSGDWSEEIFIAPPSSYVRTLPVKEAFLQFNLLWLCWRPQPQPAKWNCFSQFLAIAETVYFSWVDTRCESLKPEGWHRLWFNRRGKSWNITITEIIKSIMNLWAAYQFNHELLDFLNFKMKERQWLNESYGDWFFYLFNQRQNVMFSPHVHVRWFSLERNL